MWLWLWMGCAPEISYRHEIFPLLQDKCTRCHERENPEAGLDLYSTGLVGLIGRKANQSPLDLVVPGDSLNSYLFHKVNGTQSLAEGSGTQMPVGHPMDQEDIDLIQLWIDDGAPW